MMKQSTKIILALFGFMLITNFLGWMKDEQNSYSAFNLLSISGYKPFLFSLLLPPIGIYFAYKNSNKIAFYIAIACLVDSACFYFQWIPMQSFIEYNSPELLNRFHNGLSFGFYTFLLASIGVSVYIAKELGYISSDILNKLNSITKPEIMEKITITESELPKIETKVSTQLNSLNNLKSDKIIMALFGVLLVSNFFGWMKDGQNSISAYNLLSLIGYKPFLISLLLPPIGIYLAFKNSNKIAFYLAIGCLVDSAIFYFQWIPMQTLIEYNTPQLLNEFHNGLGFGFYTFLLSSIGASIFIAKELGFISPNILNSINNNSKLSELNAESNVSQSENIQPTQPIKIKISKKQLTFIVILGCLLSAGYIYWNTRVIKIDNYEAFNKEFEMDQIGFKKKYLNREIEVTGYYKRDVLGGIDIASFYFNYPHGSNPSLVGIYNDSLYNNPSKYCQSSAYFPDYTTRLIMFNKSSSNYVYDLGVYINGYLYTMIGRNDIYGGNESIKSASFEAFNHINAIDSVLAYDISKDKVIYKLVSRDTIGDYQGALVLKDITIKGKCIDIKQNNGGRNFLVFDKIEIVNTKNREIDTTGFKHFDLTYFKRFEQPPIDQIAMDTAKNFKPFKGLLDKTRLPISVYGDVVDHDRPFNEIHEFNADFDVNVMKEDSTFYLIFQSQINGNIDSAWVKKYMVIRKK